MVCLPGARQPHLLDKSYRNFRLSSYAGITHAFQTLEVRSNRGLLGEMYAIAIVHVRGGAARQ